MKLGVRSKLFLLSFGLVAAVLLAADLLLTRALDRFLTDRIRTDLLTRVAMVEGQLSRLPDLPEFSPNRPWEDLAQELGRSARARLTFIAMDGRVLGDSEIAPADIGGVENHRDRPEVREALSSGRGASIRNSATLDQRMMYVAVPLVHDGAAAGIVRLALPLSQVDQIISQLRGILVGASLVALLIAALLSGLAVHWASRPLRRLTEVSARLVKGELADGALPSGSDEVASLGRSLGRLAGQLTEALAQLRAEHQMLEATLEGMQEGVMVIGGDGRILHANPALRDMLLLGPEALGRSLLEVVRNAALVELLERARQEAAGASGEVELGGLKPRRLLVQANSLQGRAGNLLVVLVDVTQLRHLESVRRDFVANASHELRTPVAAIRSSAETLLETPADPEAQRNFLGIIARNAHRLQQLVEDLLDLSRIEAREFQLDPKPVELGGLLEGLVENYRGQAEKKSMRVEVAPELHGLEIRGDRRALEQVLGNLLDNGLKYGSASTTVHVTAARQGDRIRIVVADEGPGMDPRHLPRLFERFYRVDAGRSRELGGTGLGLAIVKNLVEAMGGSVSVDSSPGSGSTFSVTLPAVRTESI